MLYIAAMKLETFLKTVNSAQFAKQIGISPAYLCQISKGIRTPSLTTKRGRILINRIIQYSDNQVTLKDINPEVYEDIMRMLDANR